MKLAGKVLALTGSSGALGQAVAATLAGYGAKLALIDHAHMPPADHPPGALLYGGIDLAQDSVADLAMQRIVKDAGRLDGLVNVAGGFRWETLEGGSLETWDFMYRINLRTAVASCKAVLPHLPAGGRIVNVAAIAAIQAAAGMGAYAASKAGIMKLTEALAEELKNRRITVNAVLPSIIDTPKNRLDMPKAEFSRWVTAAEIAEVVAFLLSDASGGVTGALIPVAGRV